MDRKELIDFDLDVACNRLRDALAQNDRAIEYMKNQSIVKIEHVSNSAILMHVHNVKR